MRPTIQQLSRQIRDRSISPVELTRDCLARIDQLNPALNAFITVTADSALDQARRAEQEILRGEWRGPLHGIPIGLKDILDTAGLRTTAASALLQRSRSHRRRRSCAPAARRGRNHSRQAEPARIRLWRQLDDQLVRRGPQSMGHYASDWRIFGRLRGQRRCWSRLCRRRHRHRRFHPPARRLLRSRRAQADVRPRERPRSRSLVMVLRSRRPDRELGL